MDMVQNYGNDRKHHSKAEVLYEPDPPVQLGGKSKEKDQKRQVQQSSRGSCHIMTQGQICS